MALGSAMSAAYPTPKPPQQQSLSSSLLNSLGKQAEELSCLAGRLESFADRLLGAAPESDKASVGQLSADHHAARISAHSSSLDTLLGRLSRVLERLEEFV